MDRQGDGEGLEFAAGRYELHEVIGRGGTAVVHRATDRVTNRSVALKQLVIAADKKHRSDADALQATALIFDQAQ